MRRIGLKGGIGVGKTYVSKIFDSIGVPIFNADLEAHYIMNHSKSLINDIKKEFGGEIYVDGRLDRSKLSEIVFSDTNNLDRLNRLVHPKIKEYFNEWCNRKDSDYVIKEAAILFESNSHVELDAVICVSSPLKLRFKRLVEERNITKQEILLNRNDY